MFVLSWIMFSIQHNVLLQNIHIKFSKYSMPWKLNCLSQ
jgi:hypothetical protein